MAKNELLKTKLKKFIKDNKLTFEEGSGNSLDLVTLCGYALYENDHDRCKEELESVLESSLKNEFKSSTVLKEQFERVEFYTYIHQYGKWWEHSANRKHYKIQDK